MPRLANKVAVKIRWLESEAIDEDTCQRLLERSIRASSCPAGSGCGAWKARWTAIRYCREQKLPYLGLCVGLHCAVVEFARDVCGLKGADSTEFNPKTQYPVIFLMPGQRGQKTKGHTMRLGAYPAVLKAGDSDATAATVPKDAGISERHRHRYEVNPALPADLEKQWPDRQRQVARRPARRVHGAAGSSVLRGDPVASRVQVPPLRPHPLFDNFIRQAYEYSRHGARS